MLCLLKSLLSDGIEKHEIYCKILNCFFYKGSRMYLPMVKSPCRLSVLYVA